MTTFKKTRAFALLSLILGGFGVVTTFQNCSKANFAQNEDSLSSSSSGGLVTFAKTTMNTPVAFPMKVADSLKNATLSFKMDERNGTFSVVDQATAQIQFVPNFGFRGRQEATVVVTDRYGSSLELAVVVDVGNGLSALQPALAVRGMACLHCHAQVASNIVTDFGYGGDGKGRDYFFQQTASTKWNSGSMYGDHGPDFGDMSLGAGKTVFVPAANLPAYVSAAMPAAIAKATVVDYLKWQFDASANAGTRAVNVQTASIYIGAPTAAQIVAATKLGSARQKFYKNEAAGAALSGLQDKGTYFKNAGTLVCDGDLALQGPLLLENLVLDTKNGCRLYVVGSVFIQGPVTYANQNPNRNLQISASRAISLGLGATVKNGSVCDSRWADLKADPSFSTADSLVSRVKTMWTVEAQVTRESADARALGAAILADQQTVSNGEGGMLDAACRPEGRVVGFDRIFLNAPQVHSRYQGTFDGTIVAEFAIMSLSAFKFTFDDVFNEVPVLPFLDSALYLDVR